MTDKTPRVRVNDIHILMIEMFEDGTSRIQTQSIFAGPLPEKVERPPPQILRPATGEDRVSVEVAATQILEAAQGLSAMVHGRPIAEAAVRKMRDERGLTRQGQKRKHDA